MENPATLEVRLRHFALITHDVPAERVRPHLPPGMSIDHPDADPHDARDRSLRALVSASCFFNENFHWSPLEKPALDFEQSTYRTYVRYRGRRGVFFFKTFLATAASYASQRAISRDAFLGSFLTRREHHARKGYASYVCHVQNRREGETFFQLRATRKPTGRAEAEHAQFVTYRLDGFTRSALSGTIDLPVRHARMKPFAGELLEGRFEPWERLGILTFEEASTPVSVLVQPSIKFTLYPPLPKALLTAA